jgi:hypothetical protein
MLEREMKRYILNKQVWLKHDEVSGKYYAFLVENGDHFNLNKTGFTILNYLKEEKDLDELITLLLKEMPVEMETALSDTIEFLDLSEKNGIIAYK